MSVRMDCTSARSGGSCWEEFLRGLGVAEDDAQGLVQLVRQGAGQGADGVHARQVRQVVTQFVRFQFRQLCWVISRNTPNVRTPCPVVLRRAKAGGVMNPLQPLTGCR